MDALPGGVGAGTISAPPGQRVQVEAPSWLNPDFVKDLSQGSVFGTASSLCERTWLFKRSEADVAGSQPSGFGTGMVVGFFSQALVVLTGMAMFALHVTTPLLCSSRLLPNIEPFSSNAGQIAQRWGMDLQAQARLRKWLGKTVLDKPFNNVVFRLSFTTTFVLAAFVRF